MFKEIEVIAFECEYLFSKVRRLALVAGIEPTPRWFKSKIGMTEITIRREVRHGRRDASDAYRFLTAVRGRLLALAQELSGGDGDSEDSSPELQHSPRRNRVRRGRDLFD
jgi:hypothetical protein